MKNYFHGMELRFMSEGKVKDAIKSCEGKHIQQIAYSSYHDAFTQICFSCNMVRTSLKKNDVKVALDEMEKKQ